MRRARALWAVVVTAAQALFGCGGTRATAAESAVAPGAETGAGLGGFDARALPVEELATRIDTAALVASSSDRPSRGPATAPVTIHLFSDFECPFCARALPVLREVEAEFGGSVRVVWHDFPLPGHPHAERAAVAGDLVFRTRGGAAFWRYHDAVFQAARTGLDERIIARLAKREGVEETALGGALAAGAERRVAGQVSLGEAAGVEGTPAFIVNDWMVTGVLPYPAFRAVVARALAEAPARPPARAPITAQ